MPKAANGRRSKHEEDHDGGMHGHELQVILGRHDVAGRTVGGEEVQAGNGEVGPRQMNAHQPGEEHSDQHSDESQTVILLADDFVVEAEDVLPNEAGGRMMRCLSVRCIVHRFTSRDILATRRARERLDRYCNAACFFIQAS